MSEPFHGFSEYRPEPSPRRGSPPQYTLRQLFLLTTLAAVVCSLSTWLGWTNILLVLAPATGAFLGALLCPWVGLDYVLDNLQADVFRCLALGTYIAVVGRVTVWIAGWTLMSLLVTLGLWVALLALLCFGVFLLSVPFFVRWLWPLSEKGEMFLVAGAALFGELAAVVVVVR